MVVYSSKKVLVKKNESFGYGGEDCANVFTERKKKFYRVLQIILTKKLLLQKKTRKNFGQKKMCHICEDDFILGAKKYCKVRNPNPTREDIEEQHNQFFRK